MCRNRSARSNKRAREFHAAYTPRASYCGPLGPSFWMIIHASFADRFIRYSHGFITAHLQFFSFGSGVFDASSVESKTTSSLPLFVPPGLPDIVILGELVAFVLVAPAVLEEAGWFELAPLCCNGTGFAASRWSRAFRARARRLSASARVFTCPLSMSFEGPHGRVRCSLTARSNTI